MKTFLGGALFLPDENSNRKPGFRTSPHDKGEDHKFDWHASGARCIICGASYHDFLKAGGGSADWVSAEGRARAQYEEKNGAPVTFLGGALELGPGGIVGTGGVGKCPKCNCPLDDRAYRCDSCGNLLPIERGLR